MHPSTNTMSVSYTHLYALAWERAQFDAAVADVFGYYAWQVGLADLNLLRANRMPFKGYVGTETPSPESITGWQSRVVLAQPEALPFESQSVDLLICLLYTSRCV